MASAVGVQWDPQSASVRALSSIVGLPPVFVHQEAGTVIVASELRLIRAVMTSPAMIDRQAAVELFTIGYPIEHRTLLAGVTLMPAGHALTITTRGHVDLTRAWDLPASQPAAKWSSHVRQQIDAFRQSVQSLHLSKSVFSLTGGLDTRAILVALSEAKVRLPAGTMSGAVSLSLDARLARQLCHAYGLEHVVIPLDEQFLSNLPAYVLEASRLSGGLASLEQAHEVYFHRQLLGLGDRRLSGNLGNQVGRQGLEGVSMRNADTVILHEALRVGRRRSANEHWLASEGVYSGDTLYRLLIERECPFASVGNYSIGHHFMIQQSPYATRSLIEIGSTAPRDCAGRPPFVRRRARLRDLRHRFLGEPRKRSFQRQLIRTAGGPAAKCPINWGWRARGGISIKGLGLGTLAFIDAASSRSWMTSTLVRQGLRTVRVAGTHEIKQPRIWLNTILRDFVNDSLRARRVRESGLFDFAIMVRLLDEHYRGVRSHHATLVAALDLALAEQHLVGPSCNATDPITSRNTSSSAHAPETSVERQPPA